MTGRDEEVKPVSRISGVKKGGSQSGKMVSKTGARKKTGIQKTFQAQLTKANTKETLQELDRLAEEIEAAAQRLSDHVNWDNFIQYRDSIRQFIKLFVGEAFRIMGSKGRNRFGNQKLYLQVKTVDEKLAELGKEVMKGEQGQLNVISKIDEIRGLLLDIYQ